MRLGVSKPLDRSVSEPVPALQVTDSELQLRLKPCRLFPTDAVDRCLGKSGEALDLHSHIFRHTDQGGARVLQSLLALMSKKRDRHALAVPIEADERQHALQPDLRLQPAFRATGNVSALGSLRNDAFQPVSFARRQKLSA
jgi:hypothetical protein